MAEPPELDRALLRELFRFNASLGPTRFVKGIDYVRCIELPILAGEALRDRSTARVYLDVGSGDSILPTFVATRSAFQVTVIDKSAWVWAQARYLRRLGKAGWLSSRRFVIHQADVLDTAAVGEESVDLITALSVLEHIGGDGDSQALRRLFRLLKPGGRLLLSAPYNRDRPQDFVVPYAVYGAQPGPRGAFFQRHYSAETLQRRLLDAAPFAVERLFYAAHDGRWNLFKRFWLVPAWLKPIKVLYNWAAPFYAPRFLRLSNVPPTDPSPQMVTADTVFVFLRKPR